MNSLGERNLKRVKALSKGPSNGARDESSEQPQTATITNATRGDLLELVSKMVGHLPRKWLKAVARAQWRSPLLKQAFDWGSEFFRDHDGVIQQGAGKGCILTLGDPTLASCSEPLNWAYSGRWNCCLGLA
jgi:hypothetical protein